MCGLCVIEDNDMTTRYHAGTDLKARRTNLIYRYLNSVYGNTITIDRSDTRQIYPMMRFSLAVTAKGSITPDKIMNRFVDDMTAKFGDNMTPVDSSLSSSSPSVTLKLPVGYINICIEHSMTEPKRRLSILLS